MRIVTVSHRFYPSIGGTERFTYLYAKYMSKRGHKVTVVTSTEMGCPEHEIMDEFDVIRLKMLNISKYRIPIRYYRTIKDLDYDILHVNGQRVWCGDWIYPFIPFLKQKRVFMAHGFYQYYINPGLINNLYYKKYFVKMMRLFDHYIALTDTEKNVMTQWGYPDDRLTILPNMVFDPDESFRSIDFRNKYNISDKPIIVNIGGYYENKRVDLLIEAVAKSGEDVNVISIGKDVLNSKYNKKFCVDLAKRKGVNFHTFENLSREDIVSAYNEATIMVHPATFEGFGIVFIESLQYGTPFISFDKGIAKEVSQHGAAIVVNSVDEMAKKITLLLNNDELLKDMQNKGKRYASRFYADKVAIEYENLYKKLISEGNR
ncbi:MAG: glycosyltransferase family 4 protein [Candidatus Thermoplasmatota archaeon]|jgi:glycosyltransferase involved in cell wall biosynthesis|nr:glycosyltransferase family 4 protein [Candidatus Thermoplasmatota archaeon]MCL5963989.1 glycosyltransferase family 4 protein [Candidatus Thermoplasmatota archaeon]